MLKRGRKLIIKVLFLTMCTSLVSSTVTFAGETATSSGLTNVSVTAESDFEFDTNTGAITKYIGYDTIVVIPSTINSVPVKSIEDEAFNDCSSLTSITIPESVTSIEDSAFEDCTSLTSIAIPNSVTSIGYDAFYGCSSLISVTIPTGVTSIEDSIFEGCSSLTSITIPNSVTSIGYSAFEDCSSLTSITIPNSVTSIDDNAFENCSNLTSITIPENVTSIGDSVFRDCSNLKNITVNSNNKNYLSIDGVLFNKLKTKIIKYPQAKEGKSYIIPSSVVSIERDVFQDCISLTSITMPNGIVSIGDGAFDGCINLTSTNIPSSVKSVGGWAFYKCSSLKSIIIPNSVTSIKDETFAYCSGLTSITIPSSITSIGYRSFSYCSGLTTITIPNSVTSIGERAFIGCNRLASVTIPNSVTSIGRTAFNYYGNTVFYVVSEKVKQLLLNDGAESSKIVLNGQVPTVKITSITLNKPSLSIVKGYTSTLTTTVLPSNATNKGMTWKSNNIAVATVDGSGKITAVGAGTAIITCTASDGSGKSAICTVTVTNPIKVTSIALNKTSLSVVKGYASTLTTTILPSNATNKGVTWRSSNSFVATVDANGKVTGVGLGTATITCTAKDGSLKYAACKVTVVLPTKVTSIALNKTSLSVVKGYASTLTATILPSNATNKGVTWKSSNTLVATVDVNGKVTGVTAGTVTITATAKDGSLKYSTCKVTVTNPIKVTSIALNKTSLSVVKGYTSTLIPTILPSNATNKGVTWKSSNTLVATVDANGKVTGVGLGIATITCTAKDGSLKYAVCKVTVTNPIKVTSIALNKTSVSVVKGSTSILTATILPTNATNKGVTWKSSNTLVATVDANGKVTGVGLGTSTITCTAKDGSGKVAICKVTVTK